MFCWIFLQGQIAFLPAVADDRRDWIQQKRIYEQKATRSKFHQTFQVLVPKMEVLTCISCMLGTWNSWWKLGDLFFLPLCSLWVPPRRSGINAWSTAGMRRWGDSTSFKFPGGAFSPDMPCKVFYKNNVFRNFSGQDKIHCWYTKAIISSKGIVEFCRFLFGIFLCQNSGYEMVTWLSRSAHLLLRHMEDWQTWRWDAWSVVQFFFHPLPSREGCTGNVQIIFCRAKHRKHVLFLFLSVSKVDLFRVYIFVDWANLLKRTNQIYPFWPPKSKEIRMCFFQMKASFFSPVFKSNLPQLTAWHFGHAKKLSSEVTKNLTNSDMICLINLIFSMVCCFLVVWTPITGH